MITPGMVIAGRYRIVKQLGEGGVGAVYLAQHVHTDERLALKVLHNEIAMDPSTIERFRTEARAPARIDSDHIVRVTDADVAAEIGGAPFLVMELLKGKDLSGEAESRGPMHPKEVVLFLRQAARALDKAHGLGIVHRDLKPENIFLTVREDGTPCVKLLDFGIAKLTGGAASSMGAQSKTKTGAVFGTPLYMAPEQARSQSHLIGPATDIWALGLIAVRLLLGADYWQAETISDLIVQIVVDPIPPPSQKGLQYGPAFDQWFLRCCHRDVTQRFRTAGDAITELAASLGIVEGPALVLEVTEILQKAHAQLGLPSNTMPGVPLPVSQSQGNAPRPVFASTPAVVTQQPAMSSTPMSGTAMGSTVLASSVPILPSSPSSPSLQPSQPKSQSGSKAPLIAAVAIFSLALLGAALFLGMRKPGREKTDATAATEGAPLVLPTPQTKTAVPADEPTAAPTATDSTTTETPPPTASSNALSGRGKSLSGTTKKKPNDVDLMSGRR